MKNTIVQSIKTIILALIIAAGLQVVLAQSANWTSPPANPPSNNVAAPVNISNRHQEKLGSLFINTTTSSPDPVGLSVFGESWFNGKVKIADGSQGRDKVLTSDADGYASWKDPSFASDFDWTAANIGEDKESFVASAKISYQIDHYDCSAANGGCYSVEGNYVPATVDTCDGQSNKTYSFTMCPVSSNTTCNDWREENRCDDDSCANLYTVQCKLAQVPVKKN